MGIARDEGFRGYYRGLSANLIGVTPEKAIKLTVNDLARQLLARREGVPPEHLSPLAGMLAGATAGLCQCLATNPMEMVKINMQLPGQQRTIGSIVKTLGLRGLYRGTISTLMRDIPFSMIFFQSFSAISSQLKVYLDADQLPFHYVLLAGIIAGSIGAVMATPMDLVKTRYQSEWFKAHQADCRMTSRNIPQIWKETLRNEGAGAFFKGSLQRCMIVGPLFGVSLGTYELLNRII